MRIHSHNNKNTFTIIRHFFLYQFKNKGPFEHAIILYVVLVVTYSKATNKNMQIHARSPDAQPKKTAGFERGTDILETTLL
jgi:hypothetical protein